MPRWRPDGTELFYLGEDSTLMAVSVKRTGSSLDVGAPHTLFQTGLSGPSNYSISGDGRFLMYDLKADPLANRISVILNWQSALARSEKR